MIFNQKKIAVLGKPKEKYLATFFLAMLAATAVFLPFIIIDKGYFLFYGDFNVQQIPFYKLSHEAILSGETGWNFGTDLGVNFIGSYSFYTLGSPFFLLTLLFPNNFLPFLMGPLLILKFSLAALTSYCYIRRFTRMPESAMIGGLLYAFSGFSVYNIFFNHFHEAIILFPLLLLSLELLITENKRGFFAAMVALCAAVNYFFFFGMVCFVVIYWFVRVLSGNLHITFKRFMVIFFEAVIGLLCAAAILLPSILAILGNSRIYEFTTGWPGILYSDEQRYANIIQCFFFPPDIPARPVFFPQANAKWSSLGGWLPLFSMVSVTAILQQKKGSFLRRIICISAFIALVPVLNSVFSMLNTAYYARWFYMPILMMCLATVTAIEDKSVDWNTPFKWVAGITIGIVLVIGLFPWYDEKGVLRFGLYTYDENNVYLYRFLIASAIALASLFILKLLLPLMRKNETSFLKVSTALVIVISIIYSVVFISTGKSHSYDTKTVMKEQLLESTLTLDDSDTFRVDVYDGVDNTAMFLNLQTINAFHSIVPKSVTEFWEYVGEERGVASRPGTNTYAARSLLSVKYLLDREGRTNADDNFVDSSGNAKMPGYIYFKTQGGYNVYENKNYIPMGFTYDYYILKSEADEYSKSDRANLMVKAMILDDAQAAKYGNILTDIAKSPDNLANQEATDEEGVINIENQLSSEALNNPEDSSAVGIDETASVYEDNAKIILNSESLRSDAELRRASAGIYSKFNNGFNEKITLENDNLVFFSIPYDEGWTATVNGQAATIEKVNIGFMAVLAKAGTNDITFTYHTPGLKLGIYISIASLSILLIYYVICIFVYKNKEPLLDYPEGEELLKRFEQEKEEVPDDSDVWDDISEADYTDYSSANNGFNRGFYLNIDDDDKTDTAPKKDENNDADDGFNIDIDFDSFE